MSVAMEIRQIFLNKGKHRFCFRYRVGREDELISSFAALADDPEQNFDWFDAAVLSYTVGRQLERDLGEATELLH